MDDLRLNIVDNHLMIIGAGEYLLVFVVPSECEYIAIVLGSQFVWTLFGGKHVLVDTPQKHTFVIPSFIGSSTFIIYIY